MKLTLERAISPEYMEETECGLCGLAFRPESVIAWGDDDDQAICPDCVWYLGWRNPSRFPSVCDYLAAVERNPEPMYPSADVLLELEAEDPHVTGRVVAASAVS